MNRSFEITDDHYIIFDGDLYKWSIDDRLIFLTRHARNIVIYREILEDILYMLIDYDITDDECRMIDDYLWLFLFRVIRTRRRHTSHLADSGDNS